VTDLANATKTKSDAEVTKMFVESASYILRATVGVDEAKPREPLWDKSKLSVGQYFSAVSYMKVTNIEENKITVKNHRGESWFISKDLLVRDMWAADHFDKEVKCTMTDLAGILESCGDTIFKVKFHKKVDEKQVLEQLEKINFSDLSDSKMLNDLSNKMLKGEECELVCHLVESNNHLGRSLVIDLNAESNGYRQVDHRTIDYIILKNVKYSLGKKAPGTEDLPLKVDRSLPKWTESKLALGNWFSAIQYYKVKSIPDTEHVQVETYGASKKELTLSTDILVTEMNPASIFAKEEKVSRSNLVEILMNSKESCFTVCYRKKIDDKHTKEILEGIKEEDMKDPSKIKQISKELVTGK
jgi:hypothetical protein